MDERDQKRFERRLLGLRDELNRLIRAENGEVESGRDSMDEVDQATELIEREFGSLIATNARASLEKVNAALERLASGEYGKCQECGVDIPVKRLEALPFALYCVNCQQALEEDSQ
ncbi:MAG: TraR/DksA family transcriptional regulator [Acidobacteriota bacterium]|jgi:DnaK suppressor protein|nr:TraR/DksA family transcriptional regulator [Acidobacteriota bacterium]